MLTKKQAYSLIAIVCAMVTALMVIAIGYGIEFGYPEEEAETEADSRETSITIETTYITEVAESTEIVEESTESEPIETDAETESSTETTTEAEPVAVSEPEEEFPWYTSDYELLARLVWAEARGESFEGQLAVVEVVFNRISSPNFPNTVYDVIYEPGQFTTAYYLNNVTPTQEQYDVVTEALRGTRVLNNEKCVYFSKGSSCGEYYTTIGNHVFGVEQ